jgi:hypothetical protein
MQDSDIDQTKVSVGVGKTHIGGYRSGRIALAMHGDTELGETVCLGLGKSEYLRVGREPKSFRELALRVVVTVCEHDRDVSVMKRCKLTDDEEPGVVVAPVAVEDVTRDDNEVDLPRDSLGDKCC